MWIQDRLAAGDFRLSKVVGSENPADVLTKAVDRACLEKHLSRLLLHNEQGRAASAAQIDQTVACLLLDGTQQLRHCVPRRSVEQTSILAPFVTVPFDSQESSRRRSTSDLVRARWPHRCPHGLDPPGAMGRRPGPGGPRGFISGQPRPAPCPADSRPATQDLSTQAEAKYLATLSEDLST